MEDQGSPLTEAASHAAEKVLAEQSDMSAGKGGRSRKKRPLPNSYSLLTQRQIMAPKARAEVALIVSACQSSKASASVKAKAAEAQGDMGTSKDTGTSSERNEDLNTQAKTHRQRLRRT